MDLGQVLRRISEVIRPFGLIARDLSKVHDSLYDLAMSKDIARIRADLSNAWQRVAEDLLAKGAPAATVYETLIAAGLTGLVGLHGRTDAARILLDIAERLDRQASEEAAAIRQATAEAAKATRN